MNIKIFFSALLFFIAWQSPVVAQTVFDEEPHKKMRDAIGKTKAWGRCYIEMTSNGGMKGHVYNKTRKNGISGSGKSVTVMTLLNMDGTAFNVIRKGHTVGAHTLRGTAQKEGSTSFTYFPMVAGKVGGALCSLDVESSIGFPTNVPGLISYIGNMNKKLKEAGLPTLTDMAAGQVVTTKFGVLKKLK